MWGLQQPAARVNIRTTPDGARQKRQYIKRSPKWAQMGKHSQQHSADTPSPTFSQEGEGEAAADTGLDEKPASVLGKRTCRARTDAAANTRKLPVKRRRNEITTAKEGGMRTTAAAQVPSMCKFLLLTDCRLLSSQQAVMQLFQPIAVMQLLKQSWRCK